MATLRNWLDGERFDWSTGIIVVHTLKEGSYSPGWGNGDIPVLYYHFDQKTALTSCNDPLLDREFDCGYGAPRAPRFVATDARKVYFPCQYDGATWIESVFRDAMAYMDPLKPTPYPGG